MQLLKNKREAVTPAVSDEWWLMVEANYVHNPGWNKLSVWAGDSLHFVERICLHFDKRVNGEV